MRTLPSYITQVISVLVLTSTMAVAQVPFNGDLCAYDKHEIDFMHATGCGVTYWNFGDWGQKWQTHLECELHYEHASRHIHQLTAPKATPTPTPPSGDCKSKFSSSIVWKPDSNRGAPVFITPGCGSITNIRLEDLHGNVVAKGSDRYGSCDNLPNGGRYHHDFLELRGRKLTNVRLKYTLDGEKCHSIPDTSIRYDR